MEKKILVIEDDSLCLQLFKSMLSSAGYLVETAENGKIGLDKVRIFKPDLIILDIKMPIMDGFTVLRNLEPDEEGDLIPVIVLTSLDQPIEEEKARILGAKDFIRKSEVHLKEIINMVKKYLK